MPLLTDLLRAWDECFRGELPRRSSSYSLIDGGFESRGVATPRRIVLAKH
jgi:hypothetical protein